MIYFKGFPRGAALGGIECKKCTGKICQSGRAIIEANLDLIGRTDLGDREIVEIAIVEFYLIEVDMIRRAKSPT